MCFIKNTRREFMRNLYCALWNPWIRMWLFSTLYDLVLIECNPRHLKYYSGSQAQKVWTFNQCQRTARQLRTVWEYFLSLLVCVVQISCRPGDVGYLFCFFFVFLQSFLLPDMKEGFLSPQCTSVWTQWLTADNSRLAAQIEAPLTRRLCSSSQTLAQSQNLAWITQADRLHS